MTADKNQPASPGQRVLKMAPQVYYGYPNPQLMHIHADDVQETLPEEELPEEHGGELVGYSPVSVPYRKPSSERELGRRRWRTWRWLSWRIHSSISWEVLSWAKKPWYLFLGQA